MDRRLGKEPAFLIMMVIKKIVWDLPYTLGEKVTKKLFVMLNKLIIKPRKRRSHKRAIKSSSSPPFLPAELNHQNKKFSSELFSELKENLMELGYSDKYKFSIKSVKNINACGGFRYGSEISMCYYNIKDLINPNTGEKCLCGYKGTSYEINELRDAVTNLRTEVNEEFHQSYVLDSNERAWRSELNYVIARVMGRCSLNSNKKPKDVLDKSEYKLYKLFEQYVNLRANVNNRYKALRKALGLYEENAGYWSPPFYEAYKLKKIWLKLNDKQRNCLNGKWNEYGAQNSKKSKPEELGNQLRDTHKELKKLVNEIKKILTKSEFEYIYPFHYLEDFPLPGRDTIGLYKNRFSRK